MKIAIYISDVQIFYWQWFNSIVNGFVQRGCKVDLYAFNQVKLPAYAPGVRIIEFSSQNIYDDTLLRTLVIERAVKEDYNLCFGFEYCGLLYAHYASRNSRALLGYYSCELYDESNPNIYKDIIGDVFHRIESILGDIDFFFIQDSDREEAFNNILKTAIKPKKTFYFPVCMPRKEAVESTRFLQEIFKLPKESKILFYVGAIFQKRYITEIVSASQNFGENQYLIIHGHTRSKKKVIQEALNLNVNKKTIFSIDDLDDDTIDKMVMSADAGIVYYSDSTINEALTGRSSSKLALYIQNYKPVICPDYPSFRKDIDKYKYGICISDWDEMPGAFDSIIKSYSIYQAGAKEIFRDVFNQDTYLDNLIVELRKTPFRSNDLEYTAKLKESDENLNKEGPLTELYGTLKAKGWEYKESLYSSVFSYVKRLNNISKPSISVIIISWKYKPEVLECFKNLNYQRKENYQLIFVDNGSPELEFESLSPFIDIYVKLNTNTGAYLARNIGALFADAPILLFLDDDGLPDKNLVKSHLEAHRIFDIIALRGAVIPKSQEQRNRIPHHYYLGEEERAVFSDIEGNTSYLASAFFKVGGWDDEIVFGGGGAELSYRLLKEYPIPEKQIYSAKPVLFHDYYKDEARQKEKKIKQEKSRTRLRTKYQDWNSFIYSWKKYYDRKDLLRYRDAKSSLIIDYKKTPFISVCIIVNGKTDNVEKLISTFEQLGLNFEYIICGGEKVNFDNASKSNLLRHIINEDIKKSLSGLRNKAITESKGEYILWINSDDIFDGDIFYKFIIPRVIKYPELDLFYGDLRLLNTKTNEFSVKLFQNYINANFLLLKDSIVEQPIPSSGTIIKRKVYDQFGLYNVKFNKLADYEFYSRLSDSCRLYHYQCFCVTSSYNMELIFDYANEKNEILESILRGKDLRDVYYFMDWGQKDVQILANCEVAIGYLTCLQENKALSYFKKAFVIAYPKEIPNLTSGKETWEKALMLVKEIFRLNEVFLNRFTEVMESFILYKYGTPVNEPKGYSEATQRLERPIPVKNDKHIETEIVRADIKCNEAIYLLKNNKITEAVAVLDYVLNTIDPLHWGCNLTLRNLEAQLGEKWRLEREAKFIEECDKNPGINTYLKAAQFLNSPKIMGYLYKKLMESGSEIGIPDNSLVSVIIPCYNGQDKIEKTVKSVFNQSYKNWEIIILDDGSKDNSWGKITELASYFPDKIKTYRFEANSGVSKVRNVGVDLAEGKFLLLLDTGDEILPHCLSSYLKAASDFPDFSWYYPVTLQLGSINRFWSIHEFSLRENLTHPNQPVTSLIRKEFYLNNGGFSEDFKEGYGDWNFWLTALAKGHKGKLVREITFVYHKEPSSISSDIHKDMNKETRAKLQIINNLKNFYVPIRQKEMEILKSEIRINASLLNYRYIQTFERFVPLNGEKQRVLIYFFKNVHIPILIPIYEQLKKHNDVDIAFGYMPLTPEMRAGFTEEELKILSAYGEKMYLSPKDFKPTITFIADAVYPWVQNCGLLVNVGHGVLSKGQYYTDTGLARREEQSDLVCVPGEFHKKIMTKIISTPVVDTGMAKLDAVFSGRITRDSMLRKYNIKNGYKFILFAPTFNDELSALPHIGESIIKVIPDNKTFLLVKLHGSTKQSYKDLFRNLYKKDARVIYIDELDITPFLALADIMISDVSSAMMEFAALDKPVILYNNPDTKKYVNYNPADIEYKWRDIGIQVSNLEEMIEAVRKSFENPLEYSQKRCYYSRQLFSNIAKGDASEKIISSALSLYKKYENMFKDKYKY